MLAKAPELHKPYRNLPETQPQMLNCIAGWLYDGLRDQNCCWCYCKSRKAMGSPQVQASCCSCVQQNGALQHHKEQRERRGVECNTNPILSRNPT